MPDSDSPTPSPADHDDHFAARIQAEVMAAAERRRREDVHLARVEREIERVWADVAPPGAAGPAEELLLDRIDRLSLIDVDAPVGERPGIKQVKGAIRKGTYWYLRYMSDQLNALHNVHARLLRRMDERLAAVEAAVGLDPRVDSLVGPAMPPSAAIGELLASRLADSPGPTVVAACGTGDCVGALQSAGVASFGIDTDADAVLRGIDAGLDLRVGDAARELASLETGTLGAVVIGGALQRGTVSTLLSLLDVAVAAVRTGGSVVVVPEDRATRTGVDAELLVDRSLSAAAWGRAMTAAGLTVEMLDHDQVGVDTVVIARCP
ncbi:MAG: methionine biosynthesis protein MetW [Acidimicrobiales bacterium]